MWEFQERRIIKQQKNKLEQAERKEFAILGTEQTLSYSCNSLGFLGSFEVFPPRAADALKFISLSRTSRFFIA